MDSQKRTTPGKPFRSGRQFKRPGEAGQGERTYQPRENRFRPKSDKYQSRDNRFQKKDDRFKGKPGKSEGRRPFSQKDKGKRSFPQDRGPKIHSDLQITDGKHRGKMLKNSASAKARLTNRKLREIMFRMISRRVRAGRFLDLSAGAGIMGAEALSRGGMLASFVEKSAKMCSFIRENMKALGIKEGHHEIFEIETIPFLKRMEKRGREWDVVFYGPRYNANYDEILEYISRGICLRYRGALVIEHHPDMFFPEQIGRLKRWRVIIEGDSAASFFGLK